jgi:hypothetical protein
MIKLSWQELKTFIDNGARYKHVAFSDKYWVAAFDPPFEAYTEIDRNPTDTTDLTDWETNYLPSSNQPMSDFDTSGRPLSRTAIAAKGFTYQAREMEFTTSLLDSVVCNKHDGTSWGDCSLSFYDSLGNSLTTQVDLDTKCIETRITWSPAYDYEIIGGWAKIGVIPASDVRIWLKPALGTSSQTMVDGVNFRNMNLNEKIKVDGRSPKFFKKDYPIAGAHALQGIIKHPVGEKHKITIVWEHYKQ